MQEPNQPNMPPPAVNLQQLDLERREASGARWFFWIGALSLVNSIINMSGGDINFVIGLATTQVIDGLAIGVGKSDPHIAGFANVLALVLNLVISGIFLMFGVFAAKRQQWAFILGMVCYAADGLITLLCGMMIGAGFHVFALWCIFKGLQAGKTLTQLRAADAAKSAPAA